MAGFALAAPGLRTPKHRPLILPTPSSDSLFAYCPGLRSLQQPRAPTLPGCITIRSSRSRFAARLNSGVRPQAKQSVRSGFSRVPTYRLRSLIPSASSSGRASIIPWMRAQIPTPYSSRALPADSRGAPVVARRRAPAFRASGRKADSCQRPHFPGTIGGLTIHWSRKPIATRLFSAQLRR